MRFATVRSACASAWRCYSVRLALLAAISLTMSGCGAAAGSKWYSASGTVSINGVPAALTIVKFHPVEGSGTENPGGSATTDEQGQFTLAADDKGGGLMAGEYNVTFSQTVVNGKPILASSLKKGDKPANAKEAVPEDYRDPAKTPVKASVGKGAATFTFEIKK